MMNKLFLVAAAVSVCCLLIQGGAPASALVLRRPLPLHHNNNNSSNKNMNRIDEASPACAATDQQLATQIGISCSSFGGPTANSICCPAGMWPNRPSWAKHDWPMQSRYFANVLQTLASLPAGCRATPTVLQALSWLNVNAGSDTCSVNWSWASFQFQYYILPRPSPSERVESPFTLGEKCFAFSLLADTFAMTRSALQKFGKILAPALNMFAANIPIGATLCNEDCWACWKNQTRNFALNGTCPMSVIEFKAGFEYETVRTQSNVKYNYAC